MLTRRWYSTSEYTPKIDPQTRKSDTVLVVCAEFGQAPMKAMAYAWISIDSDEPKWYLDNDFYHIDGPPICIAEQVTHFMTIPQLPQV